jgi:hypothetical protein
VWPHLSSRLQPSQAGQQQTGNAWKRCRGEWYLWSLDFLVKPMRTKWLS